MKKDKVWFTISLASIFLILVIYLGSSLWFYPSSQLYGQQTINQVAHQLAANESDPIAILNNIADWEHDHITYDEHLIYSYPVSPFMLLRSSDPAWIMTIRRGGCGETASLFSAMAQSAGIESRIIQNPGEDHGWCEVLVNNTWTMFDPGLGKNDRFNNSGFYERNMPQGWGKPLSFVYTKAPNGTIIDVSKTYTNTGQLNVQVLKDNLPVSHAKVIIQSHSLVDNFGWKEPLVAVENFTDEQGVCKFSLGGNNYTVISELGSIFGFKNETVVSLIEGGSLSITQTLSENQIIMPLQNIVVLVEWTVVGAIVMFFAIGMLIKHWLRSYQ